MLDEHLIRSYVPDCNLMTSDDNGGCNPEESIFGVLHDPGVGGIVFGAGETKQNESSWGVPPHVALSSELWEVQEAAGVENSGIQRRRSCLFFTLHTFQCQLLKSPRHYWDSGR